VDRVPEQLDFTLIRPVEAGEDVHQRRLTGAVLAQERVHLPLGGVEVDAVVRHHTGEGLRDTAHPNGIEGRGARVASASPVSLGEEG
jgi:hypothetical protein